MQQAVRKCGKQACESEEGAGRGSKRQNIHTCSNDMKRGAQREYAVRKTGAR